MIALVTGARGFLGRPLCRELHERGATVHAVSRATVGDEAYRWWRADLEDAGQTRDLLDAVKPDTIVHLGGRVSAEPSLDLVLPTLHSLLTTTVNLLTAATERGCRRVVLVGSCEEPVAGPESVPATPYGAAKWAAGAYGRLFHRLYATPVVVVRLFMTYGPGQDPRKVIPRTIDALARGQAPPLSSADRPLDWIYVDDAVEALVRCAESPGIEGGTIDVGTGRAVTLRTVVDHLVALVRPGIEPLYGAVADRPWAGATAADVDATFARLRWRARTPLADGLAKTVHWYRAGAGEARP